MSLSTYAEWRAKWEMNSYIQASPSGANDMMIMDYKTVGFGVNLVLASAFVSSGRAVGLAPTTAAVPSRTIAGALMQSDPIGKLFFGGAKITGQANGQQYGRYILCDRLSHQGGLSGNIATTQTTNLPTAALTRYTSGVGVMAAIEVYTILGGTSTTVSCSYTNQSGGASTSPAQLIGGASFREATRFIPIMLDPSDYGIQAVNDVTLSGAGTGAVGNFGITLFRPLASISYAGSDTYDVDNMISGMHMEEILADACLFWIHQGSALGGAYQMQVKLIDC